MNRILVTGATGRVGGQVLSQLRASGAEVRAMARNPETAKLSPEVEVVRGDLTLPESLDKCLEGIQTVFLLWFAPPDTAAAALERFTRHARRVVFLSSPYKTAHPLFQQPNPSAALHAEIERLIQMSGVEWTFLRPGMFGSNALFWWAPQIRAGDVVRWPYAETPTAPIDERDIATVAVRALCEDGHAGAEYVLTGPESLSQAEQVATIGKAIGRTIRMEEMTPDEARRECGMPPPVIDMLLNAWAAAAGQPALVTGTVREVTGKEPRTFYDWAKEHAGDFSR